MTAPPMPADWLACLLEDTAAGICADTAAVHLICSHGHFLHQPAFRRIITTGSSAWSGEPVAVVRWRAAIHALEHVTLLGGALLLWWPIAGRLPEWPRPASLVQLLYLFLCTVPMTLAAAPITLADGVLYPFYLSPRAAWPLSPTADQEAAGILMWLGGTVGYLIAGTIVFFRWASREGGEEAAPSVPLAEDA